jgi:hypothetical protein
MGTPPPRSPPHAARRQALHARAAKDLIAFEDTVDLAFPPFFA